MDDFMEEDLVDKLERHLENVLSRENNGSQGLGKTFVEKESQNNPVYEEHEDLLENVLLESYSSIEVDLPCFDDETDVDGFVMINFDELENYDENITGGKTSLKSLAGNRSQKIAFIKSLLKGVIKVILDEYGLSNLTDIKKAINYDVNDSKMHSNADKLNIFDKNKWSFLTKNMAVDVKHIPFWVNMLKSVNHNAIIRNVLKKVAGKAATSLVKHILTK